MCCRILSSNAPAPRPWAASWAAFSSEAPANSGNNCHCPRRYTLHDNSPTLPAMLRILCALFALTTAVLGVYVWQLSGESESLRQQLKTAQQETATAHKAEEAARV